MRPPLVALALAAVALTAANAEAADLLVYTGGSMAAPLKAVGTDFTRATGHSLSFASGTTGTMLKRIHAGEKPDVIAISAEAVQALQGEGRIVPGTVKPVAYAIFGVAVRAGQPKPDISTPEKFKAAMLAAKSVAFPDPALGAATGIYFLKLFDQMGIAEAMRPKIIVKPVGAEVAAAVGRGEAELALTFISEMLPEKTVSIVGPLPAALASPSLYTAGVSTTSADPAAARAFIAFATSPAEQVKLHAAGVDPDVK